MSRYINADALEKYLWEESESEFWIGDPKVSITYKDISIYVAKMPAADVREVINSAWIPVSERLPMQGTSVIISANVGRLFSYVGEGWYDGYEWHDKDVFETKKAVTAWMPMPEPYRGDE